ncbi:MAG TPA: hypothetical protein VKN18_33990 [Blastocatellia bacterium]|nr:hypothetical protein [Blastocatellia bacterium]
MVLFRGTNYKAALFLVFCITIQVACTQLKNLIPLRAELVKQYNEQNIELRVVNGSTLTIALINSRFNDLQSDERQQKAREIATFAKNHYASIDTIESLGVSFVSSKSFIIASSNQVENYIFRKNELQ